MHRLHPLALAALLLCLLTCSCTLQSSGWLLVKRRGDYLDVQAWAGRPGPKGFARVYYLRGTKGSDSSLPRPGSNFDPSQVAPFEVAKLDNWEFKPGNFNSILSGISRKDARLGKGDRLFALLVAKGQPPQVWDWADITELAFAQQPPAATARTTAAGRSLNYELIYE